MSESSKNRLWQLVLVCTFAVVLSVCNKAIDSSSGGSKSSSGGIAYADFKPSDVTAVMFCGASVMATSGTNAYVRIYSSCDSSDTTTLSDINHLSSSTEFKAIKHDDLIASGFRPFGTLYVFCK